MGMRDVQVLVDLREQVLKFADEKLKRQKEEEEKAAREAEERAAAQAEAEAARAAAPAAADDSEPVGGAPAAAGEAGSVDPAAREEYERKYAAWYAQYQAYMQQQQQQQQGGVPYGMPPVGGAPPGAHAIPPNLAAPGGGPGPMRHHASQNARSGPY